MTTELSAPSAAGTPAVDAVTASIVRHGLDAAADQMLVALRRTAFSPIIYDCLDGAGAFYDRRFHIGFTTQEVADLKAFLQSI